MQVSIDDYYIRFIIKRSNGRLGIAYADTIHISDYAAITKFIVDKIKIDDFSWHESKDDYPQNMLYIDWAHKKQHKDGTPLFMVPLDNFDWPFEDFVAYYVWLIYNGITKIPDFDCCYQVESKKG